MRRTFILLVVTRTAVESGDVLQVRDHADDYDTIGEGTATFPIFAGADTYSIVADGCPEDRRRDPRGRGSSRVSTRWNELSRTVTSTAVDHPPKSCDEAGWMEGA